MVEILLFVKISNFGGLARPLNIDVLLKIFYRACFYLNWNTLQASGIGTSKSRFYVPL